jgi:hypothetical protein
MGKPLMAHTGGEITERMRSRGRKEKCNQNFNRKNCRKEIITS